MDTAWARWDFRMWDWSGRRGRDPARHQRSRDPLSARRSPISWRSAGYRCCAHPAQECASWWWGHRHSVKARWHRALRHAACNRSWARATRARSARRVRCCRPAPGHEWRRRDRAAAARCVHAVPSLSQSQLAPAPAGDPCAALEAPCSGRWRKRCCHEWNRRATHRARTGAVARAH